MCGLMPPIPQPGQIRCPTCHRPTPMAAFCTQCGAAIPSGAQVRPRGMDRDELDERIRQRRPGDVRLRRGTPLEGEHAGGYVPFTPEPEDARALREPEAEPAAPRVDNMPAEPPPPVYEQPVYEQPAHEGDAYAASGQERFVAPQWEADGDPYGGDEYAANDAYAADDGYMADEEYAYPEPYAYARPPERRGPGVLPIVGFAALAVLALGVGAALAGMLGGAGVADVTTSPVPTASATVSVEPTTEPTATEGGASQTPEPTDGPVTFPDGALITVQPCATQDMDFDGCIVDGSTISEPTMWVWIGFEDAAGADVFTLTLRSEGQTIDQQEQELGDILGCPGTCTGYLIGAADRDLNPGEYQLVVRRNDEFADSATFTVEG
jgi:hypothetical protein